MADRYKVIAKVVSQKGHCGAGHKVGDQWIIERHTPAGICLSAFNTIYPEVRAMQFGAKIPWGGASGGIKAACPDAENPLVIELTAIPE